MLSTIFFNGIFFNGRKSQRTLFSAVNIDSCMLSWLGIFLYITVYITVCIGRYHGGAKQNQRKGIK